MFFNKKANTGLIFILFFIENIKYNKQNNDNKKNMFAR